jgi:hypothetical protein
LPAEKGGQGEAILRVGLGAGDEGAGKDFASHGEADQLVAGGGDHRDLGPEYAALEAALRRTWL